MNFIVSQIIQEWKEEAKVTHIILFSIRNKVLTIYTDKPGPLIGFHGERVDMFKEKIKKQTLGYVDTLDIVGTTGIA